MLFSQLQEKDFVDRREELDGLSARVLQADGGRARSVVLSGPRGIGKTELLRHLFGRLFWKQDRVAPSNSLSIPRCCRRRSLPKPISVGFSASGSPSRNVSRPCS